MAGLSSSMRETDTIDVSAAAPPPEQQAMTHKNRFDPEPTTAELAALMGWATSGTAWGELSFDQADGFAPGDDTDLPGTDVSDDKGYGFGV